MKCKFNPTAVTQLLVVESGRSPLSCLPLLLLESLCVRLCDCASLSVTMRVCMCACMRLCMCVYVVGGAVSIDDSRKACKPLSLSFGL